MEELILKAFTDDDAHHAHLIVGKRGKILPFILDLLNKRTALSVVGNPDFLVREYNVFGVGESRLIRQMQSRKGVAGRKYFILEISSITPEAQNALLKTFEEPTDDTRFFILSWSEDMFLPTLRSRLQVMHLPKEIGSGENLDIKSAKDFVLSEPVERLRKIEDLVKKSKEDKKSEIRNFLDSLEVYLRESSNHKDIDIWPLVSLEKIINGKKILSNRGSSAKIALEDIALSF